MQVRSGLTQPTELRPGVQPWQLLISPLLHWMMTQWVRSCSHLTYRLLCLHRTWVSWNKWRKKQNGLSTVSHLAFKVHPTSKMISILADLTKCCTAGILIAFSSRTTDIPRLMCWGAACWQRQCSSRVSCPGLVAPQHLRGKMCTEHFHCCTGKRGEAWGHPAHCSCWFILKHKGSQHF